MSLERLPRTPKNEPGDQTRFGESSSSSPASTDAATFVHNEYPEHAEHGPPIDNALQHNRTASWYQEHGPPIDNALHHDEYEEDYKHHNKLLWSRIRHQIRDPMAEFMGCFILIIFGDGSVAQVVLSGNPNLPKADQSKGDYQSISWGYVPSEPPPFPSPEMLSRKANTLCLTAGVLVSCLESTLLAAQVVTLTLLSPSQVACFANFPGVNGRHTPVHRSLAASAVLLLYTAITSRRSMLSKVVQISALFLDLTPRPAYFAHTLSHL